MGADNWADCPRCRLRFEKETEALNEKLRQAYGTVPLDEYKALEAEIAGREPPETSFREDYEIYGAEDGVVQVSYEGSCGRCNLHYRFKHEHPIPGIED